MSATSVAIQFTAIDLLERGRITSGITCSLLGEAGSESDYRAFMAFLDFLPVSIYFGDRERRPGQSTASMARWMSIPAGRRTFGARAGKIDRRSLILSTQTAACFAGIPHPGHRTSSDRPCPVLSPPHRRPSLPWPRRDQHPVPKFRYGADLDQSRSSRQKTGYRRRRTTHQAPSRIGAVTRGSDTGSMRNLTGLSTPL